MNKSAWIYTNDESQRRLLLIQHKDDKVKDGDDADHVKAQTMKDLGEHACKQL